MTMTPEAALALRQPFPPESVGKLPKGGAMLDYVGHAAVTDRLLTVDPLWNWEPFATHPQSGLSLLDEKGNLWIRLTICGVTRIGVGDGKSLKECIGDALRNAAMRFGVALDLWAKENLVEFAQAAREHRTGVAGLRDAVQAPEAPLAPVEQPQTNDAPAPMTARTRGQLFALFTEQGWDDDTQRAWLTEGLSRPVESRASLTEEEARTAITVLRGMTAPEAQS